MKISKQMWTAMLRSTLVMGAVAAAALVLTAPAHAEAIGETANTGGGVITVFDDPCPGARADWYLAETQTASVGVQFGCWTVESTTQMRVVWKMQVGGKTVGVPVLYNLSGFHKPRIL